MTVPADIEVVDADNARRAIHAPLAPGRASATESRPVVLSTDDKTALDALATQVTAAAALVQETAINTVLGAKADAKSIATDTTAITAMSVWKQISASVQTIATLVAGTLSTKAVRSATGTQTSVAGSATDVTILASNANRLGATVENDSTAILYLLLANATSSATNRTVKVPPDGYYEVPFGYTGVIKGLWSSATGTARVTEFT